MDFLFFVVCTAVLLVLAFVGSTTAKVVSGVGLIILGMLAVGSGIQVAYYLADNGTVLNVTHPVVGDITTTTTNNTTSTFVPPDRYVLLPVVYVFGGLAVLISAAGGINLGGGRSGGFNFAD